MKITFYFSLLLLLCIHADAQLIEENLSSISKKIIIDEIVLENNELKAVFNKNTGALTGVTGKTAEWQFQKRAELGISFQLLVPLPQKRNNPVFGNKQQLKKYELSPDNKTITFYWEKLISERGGLLNINLTGKVSLNDAGLSFTMQVTNGSPYMIEAVAYPAIGDLSVPDTTKELTCTSVGYAGLDRVSLSPLFPSWSGYFGIENPTMIMNTVDRYILVGTAKQGFYIGCHDTSMKEMVTYNFELKPGWALAHGMYSGDFPTEVETNGKPVHIELNIWHFPFINPKETVSLSPIILKPYNGSWHHGVDIYKSWRKTWFKYPITPQWAKDVHAWQLLQINSPEDELRFQYKDLPKYGEECAKNGVKALHLVGWNDGGQDRNNPSHNTDRRLGTWQDLKEAITKTEAMGVHVILFNKYTWADRSTNWFRKELIKYATKDPYGDYHVYPGYQYLTPVQLADINTRRLIPLCHLAKAWRDIANTEFKKSIALGASGMLFDEVQHHGGATYCWDKTHGHHVPAYVFSGDIPLVKGFRSIINKVKPDYLLSGEANYDLENSEYSIAYLRIDPFDHIAIKRYMSPQGLIMAHTTGFNDRAMLNACLKYRYIISYEPYNFKGKLSDFPLTMEYGKKIDALRTLYKDFVWEGEYLDTLGATVTVNEKPFSSYAVYQHVKENRKAVVITNNEKTAIEVAIKINNSRLSLIYVSPENFKQQDMSNKIKIPPLSVVVIMEKMNE
jgi:Domain of unknown function (DUF6259)